MPKYLLIGLLLMMITMARAQNQTVIDGSRTAPISFGAGGCVYNWTNSDPSIGLPANGAGDIADFVAINKGSSPVTARIVATPERKGYAYILTTGGVLTRIDLKTHLIFRSLSVPFAPHGMVFSPDGRRLYLTDPWGEEVAVIDALEYNTLGLLKMDRGGDPTAIAISPDGSKLYVTIQDAPNPGGQLMVMDAMKMTVITKVQLEANPFGVTVSVDGKFIYVAQTGASKLAVIDAATNTLTANIPVGFGPVVSVPSSDGKLLYVSNGVSTTISVLSTIGAHAVIATLDVGRKPSGIALTTDQRYLYIVNNIESSVTIYDLVDNKILKVIPLTGGGSPRSVSLTPDGMEAYVVSGNGDIDIINTVTHTPVETVPTPFGALSFGNFITAGVSCGNGPITIDITVKPYVPPKISITGNSTGLNTTYGDVSTAAKLTVNGSDLSAAVVFTAPAGAEVSEDGIIYKNSLTLSPDANGILNNKAIYVRLTTTAPASSYSADLTISGGGGLDVKRTISGIVNKAVLTLAAKPVTKKYGELLVSGPGSTEFIATGLKNKEMVSTVTVNYGIAAPAKAMASIYAEIARVTDPVGPGFSIANYTLSEIHADVLVERIPLEVKANDLSRQIGRPNPPLTVSYKGFLAGDDPVRQLITQAVLVTDATQTSPKGKYAITVSGATATNYIVTQVPGTLIVYNSAQNILIPNTFTPNGDGINDQWTISDLQYFPGSTVSIFNRLGGQLYYSNGYSRAWDGTSNGSQLPTGTYYYLILLNGGEQRLSGAVVIVR